MNTNILLLAVIFGFSFTHATWNLVWSDEFDGTSIDTSKWTVEVNCNGGGNNELQCYTSRSQNARIHNGTLIITAIPEQYLNRGYTSARLNTARSASFLYGRFEMMAKLPNGKHLWPAFWMLPTDNVYGRWAASGEIDIMEYRGQINNKVQGTLHFGGSWPNDIFQGSGPTDFPIDFSRDFHLFAVEWDQDEIRWYLDQTMYHRMSLVRSFYSGIGNNPYTDIRQPFERRFHLLLNLAVGGGFFPPAQYGTLTPQDASNWSDPTFQIDYVRAYQWTVSAAEVNTSNQNVSGMMAEQQNSELNQTANAIVENIGTQSTSQQSASQLLGLPKVIVIGVGAGLGVLIILMVIAAKVIGIMLQRRRSIIH